MWDTRKFSGNQLILCGSWLRMMISCSWPAFFMVHSCSPASMFLVKLEMVTIAKPSRFCFAADGHVFCFRWNPPDSMPGQPKGWQAHKFPKSHVSGWFCPATTTWGPHSTRMESLQRSPNIQGYPRFTTATIGSLDVRLGAFLGKVRGLHLKWLQHPCALLCLQPHSTVTQGVQK